MKYIKKYESESVGYNIKTKYAVWNGISQEILELNEEKNRNKDIDDSYWCRTLYTYNKKTGLLEFVDSDRLMNFGRNSENIIYVSDNLQDCIDALLIHIESEKYNL